MADRRLRTPLRIAMRAWRWLAPDDWRRTIARLAVFALAAAIGAFAFVSAGLTPIAADEDHWPITRKLLKYAMTQSVRMHSLATDEPALDDPAWVLKGAGHYATDCMPCHGAPGRARARVVEHMLPPPPLLARAVEEWTPRQLHWIVKHGIKYTAMPAWSSPLRDDEVWAMVAFLRQLPAMDAARYRALAFGPIASAPAASGGARLGTLEMPPLSTVDNCARCHGADGEGRGEGAVPSLAGQREGYLLASLQAYARGERHSGIMGPVAAGLDDAQMRALARHFASLSPGANASARASGVGEAVPADPGAALPGATETGDASASILAMARAPSTPVPLSNSPDDARARGAALATQGMGRLRIPACRHCHGPGATERNPVYPRLAGQHPRYLALQLRLFQQDRRGGTRYHRLMHYAASALSEQQIEDLAAYYGSLDATEVR